MNNTWICDGCGRRMNRGGSTLEHELRAENERLRAVVDLVRIRVNAAHPMWAPELREALALLSESEDRDG